MAENGVVVDELSSATELCLHGEHANSDEYQRITTNQVQEIREKVNQLKKNCKVPSTKENLGRKMINPIHHTIMEVKKITGLPIKRHRIAMKARKERMTSQNFNLKQCWMNQKCHHCQGLKNQRIQQMPCFHKCRKVLSGTNLVKSKTKDYVKEELTRIWITLPSLSLHVSECQCKNITSRSISELRNEREKYTPG